MIDVGAALGHAVRQLLHGDRLGNDDLAHDLGLFVSPMHPLPLALAGAAHRGEAAHPLASSSVERAGDGQLAGRGGVARRGGPGSAVARASGRPLARSRRRFLFFLGGHRRLAGGGERGDLGRGRLAGAFGDLAARLLLLAPLCLLVLGALVRLVVGAFASPLLPRPSGAPLPRRACAPPRRRAPPPGAAGRPRRGRRAGGFVVGFAARPATRADARRCSSAVSARGVHDRAAAGSPSARSRRRRLAAARATTGAAGSARPGSGAAPGPMIRFLRTSTVTFFERPCEKLWRTWPGSTAVLRLERAAGRRVRGRFCSCSFVLLVAHLRFGTTILLRRSDRR